MLHFAPGYIYQFSIGLKIHAHKGIRMTFSVQNLSWAIHKSTLFSLFFLSFFWIHFSFSVLLGLCGSDYKFLLFKSPDNFCWFHCPVASPEFFSAGGGAPRPREGYHAPPPAGGPGGLGPPDGSEVSFCQTMQSIRKWIEFSNISIFFLPKNRFFLRKNSKNWTYLTGI